MTAFLGPLFISWITYWTGSFRAGMSTIIVFLCIGLLGMLTVKNDK
jgi:MFS-type transporter involved in bile tolerance (Atg22 family)